MKQGQRLNPFSVADTDQIRRLCGARLTDRQIVVVFKRDWNRDISAEEVRRICEESGKFVRIDNRSA